MEEEHQPSVCSLGFLASMINAAFMAPQVFKAYTDGHLQVLNSLFPPAVARFVRLQPLSWHGRASVQIQLLGCTSSKATPRSRSSAGGCFDTDV